MLLNSSQKQMPIMTQWEYCKPKYSLEHNVTNKNDWLFVLVEKYEKLKFLSFGLFTGVTRGPFAIYNDILL